MNWIQQQRKKREPGIRMFCFPHAGAGLASFYQWQKEFDDHVDLQVILLPGRESRVGEIPVSDMTMVIETLAKEIETMTDLPYVFFGHSMGAHLAYVLTHELVKRGVSLPEILYVSGRKGPHSNPNKKNSKSYLKDDNELVKYILQYGGASEEALMNQSLREIYLPVLRADLILSDTEPDINDAQLEIPIVAFAGSDDRFATISQVKEWRKCTNGMFSLKVLPGGHFFHQTESATLCKIIKNDFQKMRNAKTTYSGGSY